MPSLRALTGAGVRVPWVLTQPDRPAGRGRRLTAPPVKRAAGTLGLTVHQPASLHDPTGPSAWGDRPDLLVVAAYGQLLPPYLLGWPLHGCINVHASLLPRWRGAAPVQYALLAGDPITGVTLMQLEPSLDTGPTYGRRQIAIRTTETAGELHDRLAALGAELLAELLPGLLEGTLTPMPQDHERATYAPRIEKADALLDWTLPAEVLERRVRAFNPWPVAEARLNDGRRLRIWRAEALATPAATPAAAPGTILAAGPAGIDVTTCRGVLRLTEVQPPSAKSMNAAAYLAAHSVAGARFVR